MKLRPLPVDAAAEAHARHIVAGDTAAIAADCVAEVKQAPEDLYRQLGQARFGHYHILGRSRIGAQFVFRIRYFGPTVVTLHQRFAMLDGQWRVLESERVS